jgi:D-galactarolactone isomerase
MPGSRTVDEYRALQRRLGLERVVVVQPNAYADDNRLTLASLAALGPGARGVAVVRPGVADAELERLTKAGIRGLRFITLNGGTLGLDVMDALMARVHVFGWHANLQLDGRDLPRHAAQLQRLPGRFVIDHTGKFLEPVSVDDPAFLALLRLLDTGRCWVKVSGPYETSRTGPPTYDDVGRLARALIAHAPERVLWASNWPHPSARGAIPDDADLLDLLLDWAPDARVQARILRDNPAELYGF